MAFRLARSPGIPPLRTVITDGYAQCLLLPDYYNQLLTSCDPGVDQVSLQEHIVLRCQRGSPLPGTPNPTAPASPVPTSTQQTFDNQLTLCLHLPLVRVDPTL